MEKYLAENHASDECTNNITTILKEGEQIEDLQYKGFKIIQNNKGFKFGVDAVLAAYYSEELIKPTDRVLDLGTGTGIISILVAARTKAVEICGVEIQEDVADMAQRSVKLNGLEDRIRIIVDNISNGKYFKKAYFDHVITNPPYKKADSGIINPSNSKAISRHEVFCTLEDIIALSASSLKQYGVFTMINRPERLCDCMELLRKYKMEPKTIRFVYPTQDKAPSMFLVRAIKNGGAHLNNEPPLFIFDSNGNYTEELNSIYNRD